MSITKGNIIGCASVYIESSAPAFVDPSSIPSATLWYKYRTGLTDLHGETDTSLFPPNVNLLQWDDQIGVNHAVNVHNWERPKWEPNFQACKFTGGLPSDGQKHWDFTTLLNIQGDFTFSFRIRFKGLANEGLLGENNANFLEVTTPNTMTADVGGFQPDNLFTDAAALQTQVWYNLHWTRKNGVMQVHVDDGSFVDKQWGGDLVDSDPLNVAGIGSWGDAVNELNGWIQDFTYFNTALTSVERNNMNDYLRNL